jgi:hypothetical protein
MNPFPSMTLDSLVDTTSKTVVVEADQSKEIVVFNKRGHNLVTYKVGL